MIDGVEATIITLVEGEALMDRDFILNIHFDSIEKNFAIIDNDFDGYAVLTSFNPKFPIVKKEFPRNIKIVVDCSGSMGGDSIKQARKALAEIIKLLRPQDYFNIIKFGSNYEMLFKRQVMASETNLTKAKQFVRNLDADMGGTEMEKALSAAIKCPSPRNISKEIFLITDGEVWEGKNIVDRLINSEHRVFTVGVGSAVSEAFVKSLAEKTSGACELVSPKEEMAEKIVRHCKRIFLPRAEKVTVSCQNSTFRMIPQDIDPVYDGDTVIVFSRSKEKQSGPISINYMLEDGQTFSQTTDIQDLATETSVPAYVNYPGTIARLAAHEELTFENNKEKIVDIGVKYQLINEFTNFIVIDIRTEDLKAKDLPALRKVPQMLAAGWGGLGTVMESIVLDDLAKPSAVQEKLHIFDSLEYRSEMREPAYRYEADQLIEFIHSFSQRKNEHFMKFLKDLDRTRDQEQRAFWDSVNKEKRYIVDSIFEELSELKSTKSVESIKKYMDKEYDKYMDFIREMMLDGYHRYIEFIKELVENEIKEHENFIKDFINKETEKYKIILEKISHKKHFECHRFIEKLIYHLNKPELSSLTIDKLELFELDSTIIRDLKSLINEKNNEEDVVIAFLYALLEMPLEPSIPRQTTRIIQKKYKDSSQDKNLYENVRKIFKTHSIDTG